ncbi:hypothetical protein LSM04_004144 [Trypanosoma melophagium]|uniref:uncharacterized protein n=1 Tax=Trypanosoma melophagium TaxID=715481 RepID=UPI00351A5835|nr:hypothetical protein LSM04_004144 [Trypanosoma melophagium]
MRPDPPGQGSDGRGGRRYFSYLRPFARNGRKNKNEEQAFAAAPLSLASFGKPPPNPAAHKPPQNKKRDYPKREPKEERFRRPIPAAPFPRFIQMPASGPPKGFKRKTPGFPIKW